MVWISTEQFGKRTEYKDIVKARQIAIKYLARHKGEGIVFFYKTKTAKMYFGSVLWPGYPKQGDLIWARYYGCDPYDDTVGVSESYWLNINGKLR